MSPKESDKAYPFDMRIIAGQFRSRTLRTSADSTRTRPTTDRARETLFNILTNLVDWDGLRVLDLYAGSGALGIEALSRGAAFAECVERDRHAIDAMSENIRTLGITARAKIHRRDVQTFLKQPIASQFELVLADPPYEDEWAQQHLATECLASGILPVAGLLVIEHRSTGEPPKTIAALELLRTAVAGEAAFSIYRHLDPNSEPHE